MTSYADLLGTENKEENNEASGTAAVEQTKSEEPALVESGSTSSNNEVNDIMGESTHTTTSSPNLPSRLPTFQRKTMPSFGPSILREHGLKIVLILLLLSLIIMITLASVIGHFAAVLDCNVWPNLCTDKDCLRESSRLESIMNQSVDPCQNFYQYACGNYGTLYPTSSYFYDSNSIWDVLDQKSEDDIKDVLEQPVRNNTPMSAEKKGKEFFSSCHDEYVTTASGGAPLVKAIQQLGGWYALKSTWNPYHWNSISNINTFLQAVHTQYGVEPFFNINVYEDDYQNDDPSGKSKLAKPIYAIEINIGSLTMGSAYDYLYNDTIAYFRNLAYPILMRKYLTQLISDGIDAGYIHSSDPNFEQTFNQTYSDVYYVEREIANITFETLPTAPNHKPLSYLDTAFPGPIGWFELIKKYYKTAPITFNTDIDLYEEDYLKRISNLIKVLQSTPTGRRQMNNYIMWKLAFSFHSDMGWQYIHLNRDWAMAKYNGGVRFVGMYNWCLSTVKKSLGYLLSSIYVEDKFTDVAYQQSNKLYQEIKSSMIDRVKGMSWMDAAAKKEATLKLQNTKDKIGYPGWLRDKDQVNAYYKTVWGLDLLKISRNQHFSNAMQIIQFNRFEQERKLQQRYVSKDTWSKSIWIARPWYDPWWNEIFMPAGLLQSPAFDYRVPAFLNYATTGTIVTDYLEDVINDYGQYWDHNGFDSNVDWWSKSVQKAYASAKDCHARLYMNNTFCYSDGDYGSDCPQMPHTSTFGGPDMMDTGAMQNAFQAYRSYVNSYGAESSLPGFISDNTDEIFLIAFAQTWCTAERPYAVWLDYKNYHQVIPEAIVNKMMTQMPQFKTAYSCPSSSPMAQSNSCPGF